MVDRRIGAIGFVALVIGGPFGGQAAVPLDSQSLSMPFAQCLEVIRRTATELGVAPVNIVETSVMRMVRFPTADGSVLVTCSAVDQKAVFTVSPHR